MTDLQGVPNLSMKHLRAVVTLARFGSFIAAASYLRVSQPGLSRIIQQAEGRLGVRLFVRSARSVSQTEAGREFIPAALVVFRKKNPKMHVQIREGLTSAVHEDVRSGIADFGIGNAMDLAEGVLAESIVHEACYVVCRSVIG